VKKSPFHKVVGLAVGAISDLPFSVLAHKSRAMQIAIRSLSSKESYDVVHFDTLALIQFDPQLRKAAKVLVHQNIESTLMERRADAERTLPARKYLHRQAQCLRRYEYLSSKTVSVNVVVSENDGTLLRVINPHAAVEVVPNGVDIDYFSQNDESETMSLIYTGGMNMFANRDAILHFLKHSWQLVKAEEPGVNFYVVGQDPSKELLEFAEADKHVIVTGYVDDVRPYISQSAVYVVPLRVGGGTRLKILDAMSMKKAIVSTSIGCEGLEVTPNKNLLIADDPVQFAENILRLLRNTEERKRLGLAARKLVEKRYSWENIGKTQQEVYERVVRARGGC